MINKKALGGKKTLMSKKSIKLLLISLLALSMFLAGCGGETTKETGGKKEPATSGGSAKDTLVYGRGGDSTSLDPITTTEGEAFKVTENIFETLLQYGDQDTTLHLVLLKNGRFPMMD